MLAYHLDCLPYVLNPLALLGARGRCHHQRPLSIVNIEAELGSHPWLTVDNLIKIKIIITKSLHTIHCTAPISDNVLQHNPPGGPPLWAVHELGTGGRGLGRGWRRAACQKTETWKIFRDDIQPAVIFLPGRTFSADIPSWIVSGGTLLWQILARKTQDYRSQQGPAGAPWAWRCSQTPWASWRASWWWTWPCWEPCWCPCSHDDPRRNGLVILKMWIMIKTFHQTNDQQLLPRKTSLFLATPR